MVMVPTQGTHRSIESSERQPPVGLSRGSDTGRVRSLASLALSVGRCILNWGKQSTNRTSSGTRRSVEVGDAI